MRMLFSLYKKDYETSTVTAVYSKWIYVESAIKSIEAVEKHFQYNGGYWYEAFLGQNLSFCDFFCFFNDINAIISIVEGLSYEASKVEPARFPRLLRIHENEKEATDISENDNLKNVFLYYRSRYECGAQGTEDIIYWMSDHPVEMIFIAGFLWDCTKWSFIKIKNALFRKNTVRSTKTTCVLPTKRIYRNFEKITKIKAKDCQIIKLKQNNKGKIRLAIRTVNNEVFKICCLADGTIETITPISIEEFYSEEHKIS